MENTDFTESHLLMDKMDVDLNVLGTAVVDRIGCHVNNVDVVTVDNGGGKFQGNKPSMTT